MDVANYLLEVKAERNYTMENIINKMRCSDKSWYKHFFADSGWVKENSKYISPVQWRGKTSENSFCFGDPNPTSQDGAIATLRNVFPFINEKTFREATNGDGHEWKRITRLHSSSLLALLMFSQISETHRLVIHINGRDEEFSDVRFEVKNWIEDNDTHPSNMDVVLSNNTTILFIESKFTEYLCCSRESDDISEERYGKRFQKLFEVIRGIECETDRNKSTLRLSSSDGTSHYIEGIKQLVAHYMGLEYATKQEFYNQGGNNPLAIGRRDVYLGEVLFDFSAFLGRRAEKHLEDYKELYQKVTAQLFATSDLSSPPRILPELLTYQQLFKGYTLDKNVARFYRFKV